MQSGRAAILTCKQVSRVASQTVSMLGMVMVIHTGLGRSHGTLMSAAACVHHLGTVSLNKEGGADETMVSLMQMN